MPQHNRSVNVRLYDEKDLFEIWNWFRKRGLSMPPKWAFSNEGFIVPGVAAGFLYLTNSSIAYIDFYITNPDAGVRDRMRAVHKITETIIGSAKVNHDVKMLYCNSKIRSIQNLAKYFEFKSLGKHAVFCKNL